MSARQSATDHVTGLIGKSGDPSPVTAFGVYRGMKACARHRYGDAELRGKTVAIQGCGHVGYYLAELLYKEGAELVVTDIDKAKVEKVVKDFEAKAVGSDEIYGVQANVFAPCALGGIINDQTIAQLKVDIIAGGANNQLAEERIPSYKAADRLAERRIAAIAKVRQNFV